MCSINNQQNRDLQGFRKPLKFPINSLHSVWSNIFSVKLCTTNCFNQFRYLPKYWQKNLPFGFGSTFSKTLPPLKKLPPHVAVYNYTAATGAGETRKGWLPNRSEADYLENTPIQKGRLWMSYNLKKVGALLAFWHGVLLKYFLKLFPSIFLRSGKNWGVTLLGSSAEINYQKFRTPLNPHLFPKSSFFKREKK